MAGRFYLPAPSFAPACVPRIKLGLICQRWVKRLPETTRWCPRLICFNEQAGRPPRCEERWTTERRLRQPWRFHSCCLRARYSLNNQRPTSRLSSQIRNRCFLPRYRRITRLSCLPMKGFQSSAVFGRRRRLSKTSPLSASGESLAKPCWTKCSHARVSRSPVTSLPMTSTFSGDSDGLTIPCAYGWTSFQTRLLDWKTRVLRAAYILPARTPVPH